MPHAVIVGAGLGGLAAAIRLGARGYRVTVLDRWRFRAAGLLSSARMASRLMRADDHHVPFVLEETVAICRRNFHDDVALKALDPFYTIRFDDGDTSPAGPT